METKRTTARQGLGAVALFMVSIILTLSGLFPLAVWLFQSEGWALVFALILLVPGLLLLRPAGKRLASTMHQELTTLQPYLKGKRIVAEGVSRPRGPDALLRDPVNYALTDEGTLYLFANQGWKNPKENLFPLPLSDLAFYAAEPARGTEQTAVTLFLNRHFNASGASVAVGIRDGLEEGEILPLNVSAEQGRTLVGALQNLGVEAREEGDVSPTAQASWGRRIEAETGRSRAEWDRIFVLSGAWFAFVVVAGFFGHYLLYGTTTIPSQHPIALLMMVSLVLALIPMSQAYYNTAFSDITRGQGRRPSFFVLYLLLGLVVARLLMGFFAGM